MYEREKSKSAKKGAKNNVAQQKVQKIKERGSAKAQTQNLQQKKSARAHARRASPRTVQAQARSKKISACPALLNICGIRSSLS
jgi:hypothetical protein